RLSSRFVFQAPACAGSGTRPRHGPVAAPRSRLQVSPARGDDGMPAEKLAKSDGGMHVTAAVADTSASSAAHRAAARDRSCHATPPAITTTINAPARLVHASNANAAPAA